MIVIRTLRTIRVIGIMRIILFLYSAVPGGGRRRVAGAVGARSAMADSLL